jgi:hypothetical protein
VQGRKQARVAGGELLLAAPQPQVLQLLTLTRLIDVFLVCTSVDEAACSVSHFPRAAVPVAQWRLGNFNNQVHIGSYIPPPHPTRIRKLEFARRLVIGLSDDVCGFR